MGVTLGSPKLLVIKYYVPVGPYYYCGFQSRWGSGHDPMSGLQELERETHLTSSTSVYAEV